MKDVHGERIQAAELIKLIAHHFHPGDELLIMVGREEAALMAWSDDGPSPKAINLPVFTQMPEFYARPDAPRVDYTAERSVH